MSEQSFKKYVFFLFVRYYGLKAWPIGKHNRLCSPPPEKKCRNVLFLLKLSVCSQSLKWPRAPAVSLFPSIAVGPAMRNTRLSLLLGCVLLCSVSLLYLGMSGIECPPKSHRHRWMEINLGLANQNLSLNEHFPEETPLIFIGGFPRSGTTLIRVMLDAHRHVRCGEETRVIPRLLTMRATWSRSVKERMRLDEAGVTDQVLDSAVRAFLLEVSCYSDR